MQIWYINQFENRIRIPRITKEKFKQIGHKVLFKKSDWFRETLQHFTITVIEKSNFHYLYNNCKSIMQYANLSI